MGGGCTLKRIGVIFSLLILIGLFFLGDILFSNEVEQPPEANAIKVQSLLRRYGRQEEVVLIIQNQTDNDILFPDNQYGMTIFKRQMDGMWNQVVSPLPIQSQIHLIRPGEEVELSLPPNSLAEGEYRVVFEGWHRGEFGKLLKGNTGFLVVNNPTFRVNLNSNSLKTTESFDIIITNDRNNNIIFDNNTLNLRLFIKNETDNWMELPNPLYQDNVPFELKPGQTYTISMPAVRASGEYRITLSGQDEKGLELTAKLEFSIIR